MKGVSLRFYMQEVQKHQGLPMHEWLLEFAKKNGIRGGSAFRAIAGYGRLGIMHEEHFFELAANVPVEVCFFMKKEESTKFLKLVKNEKADLFYSIAESEFGIISEI